MRKTLLFVINIFCVISYGQTKAVRNQIVDLSSNKQEVVLFQQINQLSYQDSLSLRNWTGKRSNRLQRIDDKAVPIFYATNNALSREVSRVNTMSSDLGRQGLYGRGMYIAVIDADLALSEHQEFRLGNKSRVEKREEVREIFELSLLADRSEVERDRNHATHVTGTIAATGNVGKAKGIAPQSSVLSYRWENDYQKIAAIAQDGVLLSNHSYGISVVDENDEPLLPVSYFGTYNRDAEIFDKVAYTYPYYLPIVAAGNSQQFADKINPSKNKKDLLVGFSTAKNVLVVGAISVQNGGGVPWIEETNFSSYGPTNDFRVKPDVVASGDHVFSTGYRMADGVGEQEKINTYAYLSGTSMATPTVTGIVSLWQEWGLKEHNFPFKSATMRALAVLTAQYLEEYAGPSYRYGWGLIDATQGVNVLEASKSRRALLKEGVLINGKAYVVDLRLEDKADYLAVVLAWTDFPSINKVGKEVESKDLVNDLDVRVFFKENEYMPWRLRHSFQQPLPEKGDNDVDNVERIDIDSPDKGTYKIVVSHKKVLKDQRQAFSLLASSSIDLIMGEDDAFRVDNVQQLSFDVWPNPAQEVLYIHVPKEVIFTTNYITLYDSSGRFMKDIVFKSTDFYKIDVSDLSSGMYFLKIKGNGKFYSAKFIKN